MSANTYGANLHNPIHVYSDMSQISFAIVFICKLLVRTLRLN